MFRWFGQIKISVVSVVNKRDIWIYGNSLANLYSISAACCERLRGIRPSARRGTTRHGATRCGMTRHYVRALGILCRSLPRSSPVAVVDYI